MPADRDLALSAPGAWRRDLARRLGVAGFWRWWMQNLSALVPAGPRAALERRRMRPVVAFDADRATLWQPQNHDGRIDLVEVARVALAGDAASVVAEGRQALARLSRSAAPVKVAVAMPPRSVLRKTLTFPAAVEPDLRQTLAYDLDRHTPFKPDELYFDAQVVARDPARGNVEVDLVTARRAQVDAVVAHAQAWGAKVVAVTPVVPPALVNTTLNLLPPELRNGTRFAKRWQFWLPIALLGVVALMAVVLPVWQKREYAIELNALASQAQQQAGISETLRNQLERQIGDYNFALERKYAFPGTVRVLDDVTKILPDDTWLTQLEIKSGSRGGKEAQRDVTLRGESANAGRLVTLLEDSRLFTQAAPRSPTTKIQPGPGEIFDVGAQLKALPMPESLALASVPPPAAAAATPSPSPGPAAAAAAAPARPAAGSDTAPQPDANASTAAGADPAAAAQAAPARAPSTVAAPAAASPAPVAASPATSAPRPAPAPPPPPPPAPPAASSAQPGVVSGSMADPPPARAARRAARQAGKDPS